MTKEIGTAPTLSVVVLALDEADLIEPTYRALAEALVDFDGITEILLFDDGSTDQTLERMRNIAAQDTRVRVLSHKHNMGIGPTIRAAVRDAGGEFILFLPGDHSYGGDAIRVVLKECGSADVVSGWRLNTGAVSSHRRMVSQLVEFNLRMYSRGAPINSGGNNIYRTSLFRESLGKCKGHLFVFETVARLSMQRPSVTRVWVEQLPESGDRSSSVKLSYVLSILAVNARLLRIRLGWRHRRQANRAANIKVLR